MYLRARQPSKYGVELDRFCAYWWLSAVVRLHQTYSRHILSCKMCKKNLVVLLFWCLLEWLVWKGLLLAAGTLASELWSFFAVLYEWNDFSQPRNSLSSRDSARKIYIINFKKLTNMQFDFVVCYNFLINII